MNTCDYLLTEAQPDDVAVVETADRVFTYGQLRRTVDTLAAALTAAGLARGARVGVLGANSFFWVAGYLAILKLGFVAVPLSDRSGPEEVRRNLEQVGCAAVLVDRRTAAPVLTALSELVTITDEALAAPAGASAPSVQTDPNADAVLMFTSGTTARPKVVRVTHANLQANTNSILAYLGLRSDDRILVVLPFYYCYGASLLHTHLRAGARVVLCNSMAFPGKVVDLLAQQACTGFAGVPSSYQLLLRASTFGSRPVPTLRTLQQAGGKLPVALIEQVLAAQPQARLFVMYGQTEATARLSYLPPERLADKLGSIGRGIPGVELRVLDDEGQAVRPGHRAATVGGDRGRHRPALVDQAAPLLDETRSSGSLERYKVLPPQRPPRALSAGFYLARTHSWTIKPSARGSGKPSRATSAVCRSTPSSPSSPWSAG